MQTGWHLYKSSFQLEKLLASRGLNDVGLPVKQKSFSCIDVFFAYFFFCFSIFSLSLLSFLSLYLIHYWKYTLLQNNELYTTTATTPGAVREQTELFFTFTEIIRGTEKYVKLSFLLSFYILTCIFICVMMSDDRKQSMMDYQPEDMHFRKSTGRRLNHGFSLKESTPTLILSLLEPLTSNLPVSPPHSPVASKTNVQEEVSTHGPTVPQYHFNFLGDDSEAKPYASAQQQKDEALTQTQQQWESKQPVQQQQTVKLKASDFCLERTLGTGSFGRVHLVQSKVNHLYYAMKVLSKELVVRKKQVEHTVNERSVLMAVDYPFLIKLWGTFQDAANLYMVMEFVSGGEVFSLLRKQQVSRWLLLRITQLNSFPFPLYIYIYRNSMKTPPGSMLQKSYSRSPISTHTTLFTGMRRWGSHRIQSLTFSYLLWKKRFETRKPSDRYTGSFEDHWFRVCKVCAWCHLHHVWHPWLPGPGDHRIQRIWQGSGLLVARDPYLWNASRVSKECVCVCVYL